AYRGGYLPEERRALERSLRSRDLLGLATTNALELGVDIAGLDAVLVAGWPGRRASLWQQVGRAGRGGSAALALFIAADDPLDTYVVEHPDTVFAAPVEATVIDPTNPNVLGPHLAAAAQEFPLTEDDAAWFGPSTTTLATQLAQRGILRRRPTGWYWARQDRAADHVTLRGTGPVVSVVDQRTGRVVGTVDEASAHVQVHTGAVHVHQGQTWVVTELDLSQDTALAVAGDPGWSTSAQERASFRIVAEQEGRDHGPVRVSFGSVQVTSQVVGFMRRLPSGEVLGSHPLDLPPRTLHTQAVWWTMPETLLAQAGIEQVDIPGSAHAAEHAAIGLLPLFATCDRWDIGGVSTALHPDTGLPTIMVHDGYPGGVGFAQRAHAVLPAWLRATRDAVAGCACESGCPACVQSPKCGNGNEPLDKAGAVRLLDAVLAHVTAE
ncbi:DEAD/DEAH box helicase, partial [Kribbia dieselivorans]|uniref:DEAD/DEAH box helicase n=1 Tax=Kribbia dieselivorans TaxID=331526 RepID=UPI0012ED75F6